MNYASDDRHRSLRRFLMAVLGSPPWTVRTERVPVADEERPVALVEPSSATVAGALPGRVSIPQGTVERMQTYSIMLWPAFLTDGAGEQMTPSEARVGAEAAADLLERAISTGLVDDDEDSPWNTHPERIPVFDYAGVPVKGTARRGPAQPYGVMWVEEFPVRPIQDPDDPLRWTVTCDLRLSWEQAGRERPDSPIATSFPGHFEVPEPA